MSAKEEKTVDKQSPVETTDKSKKRKPRKLDSRNDSVSGKDTQETKKTDLVLPKNQKGEAQDNVVVDPREIKKPRKGTGRAIVWLLLTVVFSVTLLVITKIIYSGKYPLQDAIVNIHSAFAFVLTAFFFLVAYYVVFKKEVQTGFWSKIGTVVWILLTVCVVLFAPLSLFNGIGSIANTDDLFRIVTINFTILMADSVIPALACKKEEKNDNDDVSPVSLFLIGTCAIASLVLALFATNDAGDIALVGRLCVFYCFGCILFTIEHFFTRFPVFKRLFALFSDIFGKKDR